MGRVQLAKLVGISYGELRKGLGRGEETRLLNSFFTMELPNTNFLATGII